MDAGGTIYCINNAFERIGITTFRNKLFALNFDGSSVNLGRRRGVATLLKNDLPWLLVVHVFIIE